MKIIVYQTESGGVGLVSPGPDCSLGLVAAGSVPHGVPYWITNRSMFPADRSSRNTWKIDVEKMGKPDGFGGQNG